MAAPRQGLPVRLERAPHRGAAFALSNASKRACTRSIDSRSRGPLFIGSRSRGFVVHFSIIPCRRSPVRSTYSALSGCGARRAWGQKACSGDWLTEPQPRAAINLYRNWRCAERGIVRFSYDRGLGSGSFRFPASDTRSRRDRRLLRPRRKPSRCDQLCIAHGITAAAGNHRGRHYLTTRPCLIAEP